jgi:hypothetical protein
VTNDTRCARILEVEAWAVERINHFSPPGSHGILGPAPGCGEPGGAYDQAAFMAHEQRTRAILLYVLEVIDCEYYGLDRMPPEIPDTWLPEAERILAAFERRWQSAD